MRERIRSVSTAPFSLLLLLAAAAGEEEEEAAVVPLEGPVKVIVVMSVRLSRFPWLHSCSSSSTHTYTE